MDAVVNGNQGDKQDGFTVAAFARIGQQLVMFSLIALTQLMGLGMSVLDPL